MIAEIGAWVALLAALLSIGVEAWRFSSSRGEVATSAESNDRSSGRGRGLRRLTPWSLFAVVVLAIAAFALASYSTAYTTRAELLRNPISDSGATTYSVDEQALILASDYQALSEVMIACAWLFLTIAAALALALVIAWLVRMHNWAVKVSED